MSLVFTATSGIAGLADTGSPIRAKFVVHLSEWGLLAAVPVIKDNLGRVKERRRLDWRYMYNIPARTDGQTDEYSIGSDIAGQQE